ncbi:MAG TPA: 50S ribosomal protein L25/general stress protein Ctc [Actinomycetota bacterium]|jgi:large subunit ribosomal protein L25|nr:50S ribosomal protein L25/general stress protein Ctc [Actinomycetota bacterium]
MAELKLQATRRDESGKGAARRARAAGRVPAVLYGRGMDPVSLEVDRREFVTALKTDAGMNVLLDIEFDGTNTLALTRELQRDPVRGTLLHADFVKVDRTQAIEVEVPVHLVGEAQGTKEGGALENPLFSVHVRTLPGNVPEAVEADVSAMNIGDTLRVADLRVPADVEILNDPEAVVASIAAPITEEELEAMEAEAGIEMEAPEPEVVEEGAEPAEEEAAPAEEQAEES